MSEIISILGVVFSIVLGAGWVYSSHKNKQLRELEKYTRELARKHSEAIAEKDKEIQKAEASEAGKKLSERMYEAVLNKRQADTDSDVSLSEEDKIRAKTIMDNHNH